MSLPKPQRRPKRRFADHKVCITPDHLTRAERLWWAREKRRVSRLEARTHFLSYYNDEAYRREADRRLEARYYYECPLPRQKKIIWAALAVLVGGALAATVLTAVMVALAVAFLRGVPYP